MEKMEDLDKIKLLLGISDSIQDTLIQLLMDDSQERLTSYINQDSLSEIKFPNNLSWIIRELTVRRFNRIGDEGKQSSSESDVSTTWNNNDVLDYAVYLDKYRNRSTGAGIARFF